jgi:thiamine transporter ThiT
MNAKTTRIVPKDPLARVALGTVAILMIPLFMMQVSDDWNWGPLDFVLIGLLLFGTGSVYVLMSGMVRKREQRLAIGFLLAFLCLWLWAELAVGIFTTWGS